MLPTKSACTKIDQLFLDFATLYNHRRKHESLGTQQVMLFAPDFPMKQIDEELGVEFDRSIYVVINNKLDKPNEPVKPRLLAIAGAAASSLIGGSGTGNIYKVFAIANRDEINLNFASIPREFNFRSLDIIHRLPAGLLQLAFG